MRIFDRSLVSIPKEMLCAQIRRIFREAAEPYRLELLPPSESVGMFVFSWSWGYQIVEKAKAPLTRSVTVEYSRLWPLSAWEISITSELQRENINADKTVKTMGPPLTQFYVHEWTKDSEEVMFDQFRSAISWRATIPNGSK